MTIPSPLPAPSTPADLRENEAKGEIAAIFADIRATQGGNNVNYIWRHLATIPGALGIAWGLVKTRHGEIQAFGETIWAAAGRLGEAHGIAPIPLAALPEEGRAVLDSYARGNRWNLAALTLLLDGGLPSAAVGQVGLAPASGHIPPLPAFGDLPDAVKDAIDSLAKAGPAADSAIRPSLWVHLALWPEFLLALEPRLAQVLRSQPFRQAHAELLSSCRGPGLACNGMPEAAIVSLNRFRRRIAEMTLLGAAFSSV